MRVRSVLYRVLPLVAVAGLLLFALARDVSGQLRQPARVPTVAPAPVPAGAQRSPQTAIPRKLAAPVSPRRTQRTGVMQKAQAPLAFGTQWTHEAEIHASNADDYDMFGVGFAIYADTLVVGAPDAELGLASRVGAAYVFERNANGQWNETQILRNSDAPSADISNIVNDSFGQRVELTSEFLVISAPGNAIYGHEDCNVVCMMAGSVHVFRKQGSQWTEVNLMTASDIYPHAYFGSDLALDGRRLVVGAPQRSYGSNINTNEGAAYVYDLDSAGQDTCEAKLTADDPESFGLFGYSVAISGDLAIVGEPSQNAVGSMGGKQGAAYVFRRTGACTWVQEARLVASDGAANDRFGLDVDIEGSRAVVGATESQGRGAVYMFDRSANGTWTQTRRLESPRGAAPDDALGDPKFGRAVHIQGSRILIGEMNIDTDPDDVNTTDAGLAYNFEITPRFGWQATCEIRAPEENVQARFGNALASHGNYLVVGADGDRDNGLASGSVHVFRR